MTKISWEELLKNFLTNFVKKFANFLFKLENLAK